MKVCIVNPDSIFFQGDVEELVLPTTTGYMGVLKNHCQLTTTLDNGVFVFREGTAWKIFSVGKGFSIIKDNRVDIVCLSIEEAANINIAEAEQRVATARAGMDASKAKRPGPVYIQNQLVFDRERGRVKAHRMWQSPPLYMK